MDSKLLTIRSKKVGICIKDARVKARKSVEETAQFLGIPESDYLAMEEGNSAPSFPQLETLSHLFHVPFDSLTTWQAKESGSTLLDPTVAMKLNSLRDHVIAAYVTKARLEKGLTLQTLSERTGISVDDLSSYEMAEKPIPFPLIGELCQVL
jgi:transcriptional regulator with XRE-family HTH domain